MKKSKGDKPKLVMIGAVAVLVMLSLGTYALFSFKNGQLAVPVVAIVAGIFALFITVKYLKNRYSEVEKGYPLVDERGKRVMLVAAAKSYILSIWFLLIVSFLSNDVIKFRDASQALNAGILGMALLLGITWLYYRKKENIEEVSF